MGQLLIHNDGPAKADIGVVLAGDDFGFRVVKSAELVRDGYIPAVLVSGPPYFHIHESDVAIAYAVSKGFPAGWFIPFPNDARSTREEAAVILPELQRRGIRRFLLVTSDYHTARAGRIYRAQLPSHGNLQMQVVAAPDAYFRANSWWRDRDAQKIVFFEWSKTVATALGH
jgi:uncharacterized SAM-binding protein YcdF (DUF218 family)